MGIGNSNTAVRASWGPADFGEGGGGERSIGDEEDVPEEEEFGVEYLDRLPDEGREQGKDR